MSPFEIIRIIFGLIYLCFMPGLVLIWAIFGKKEIDFISRFTLSIVFSLAAVTTLVYLLNFVNVKITTTNLLWETGLIIVVAAAIGYFRNKH